MPLRRQTVDSALDQIRKARRESKVVRMIESVRPAPIRVDSPIAESFPMVDRVIEDVIYLDGVEITESRDGDFQAKMRFRKAFDPDGWVYLRTSVTPPGRVEHVVFSKDRLLISSVKDFKFNGFGTTALNRLREPDLGSEICSLVESIRNEMRIESEVQRRVRSSPRPTYSATYEPLPLVTRVSTRPVFDPFATAQRAAPKPAPVVQTTMTEDAARKFGAIGVRKLG